MNNDNHITVSISQYGSKKTYRKEDISTLDEMVEAFQDILMLAGYSKEFVVSVEKESDEEQN